MTNKKRKGELTSGQIVSIVILAVSFIVILFILYKSYNWNPLIDRETCHQSVVYRSSVNYAGIQTSRMVPLKCQTEKICLTMGGKECIQVGKNTPANPVTTVKLDKDIISARQQVINTIAESMYDCHSMLGEGQLLFMPQKTLNYNYCLICTRFVIDEEARQKLGDIKYTELYQNLGNKVAPNKKTYLEYLHPDWKDWHSIWNLFLELKNNIKDDGITGDVQFRNNGEITIESDDGLIAVKKVQYTYRKDKGWYWNYNNEGWYSTASFDKFTGGTYIDVGPFNGPNYNEINLDFIKSLNGKSCALGVNALLVKADSDNKRLAIGTAKVILHRGGGSEELKSDSLTISNLCDNMESLKLGAEKKSVSRSDYTIEDWKINLEDERGFVLVAQIAPKRYLESFAVSGATTLAIGAIAATGFGAPVALTLAAAGGAGAVAFWYNSPTGEFAYSPPHVEPYNLERLQSLNCDSFETAP